MNKKIFKVEEWLPTENSTKAIPLNNKQVTFQSDKYADTEQLIHKIENAQIDITANYADWRNIGFALADEFGENGRDFYLRISRFYNGFSNNETDKQFDACLKANGAGINLNTLFYLAKNAGITISKKPTEEILSVSEPPENQKLPTLPDAIFKTLPNFLQRITDVAETNEERDLLLLGSVVTLSATMPTVFGIYHNKKVFANLFLFISAQASAGKGRLNHCRKLVKPIHDALKEANKKAKQQYQADLAYFNTQKKKNSEVEKPEEPPLKLLFIPANSSASGAFQLLNDNNGRGLLFETEGDTLANTFKSDFGNYSDGFRKAFHHETISYYRKTDRELVDLETPCISTVLSGTPKQVLNLIPSAEDGLFSRFMFYFMNTNPAWADVFSGNTETGLDDIFYDMGKEYLKFYDSLNASPNIQFTFTREQQEHFNIFFQKFFTQYFNLKGEEYIGTIRRLGLITFRLAMIFSVLRMMDQGEFNTKLVCEEQDYKSAISIAETLIVHASHIFSQLPEADKPVRKPNIKERYFDALPAQFNRKTYLEVASQLGVLDKTAQSYIASFKKDEMVHHDGKDVYIKNI
jgi:hypothetical protein